MIICHRMLDRIDKCLAADPLAEEVLSPVPGLIHRYPDRVVWLVSNACAVYCRFCMRKRQVGCGEARVCARTDDALHYLREHPEIRDVILSGGDPLLLADEKLEEILRELRAIPHVEIIRIGSRIPVFMPQRVDQDLGDMLARYHPLWLNIHVNHPNEITLELAQACDRLTRAGIPLGIKDLFCTKGVRTTACSHILDGFTPTYESTVTANLWAEGVDLFDQGYIKLPPNITLVWPDDDFYYNYQLNDNGIVTQYGSATTDYSTDVLAAKAANFILNTPSNQPLFLEFTPNSI